MTVTDEGRRLLSAFMLCEHRNLLAQLNWINDGKGGTKPDGKGRSIYCQDCKTRFVAALAPFTEEPTDASR